MSRYSFSGHESFFCKAQWLKKGYDAIENGIDFTAPDAVAKLGVGKNMVSSIRFWLKAFGISTSDSSTQLGKNLFDDYVGYDPYVEDEGTLWLLHYKLVTLGIASIYSLAFLEFQREKKEFDREQFLAFIKRKCNVPEQKNVYNENTVKKDISVFLHNYVAPKDKRSAEDYSGILIDLGLIRSIGDDKYAFVDMPAGRIESDILLYALLDYKGEDNTISLDVMQEVALIFGLSMSSLIEIVQAIAIKYPEYIAYSDNSGIKNIQFLKSLDKDVVLQKYYEK